MVQNHSGFQSTFFIKISYLTGFFVMAIPLGPAIQPHFRLVKSPININGSKNIDKLMAIVTENEASFDCDTKTVVALIILP